MRRTLKAFQLSVFALLMTLSVVGCGGSDEVEIPDTAPPEMEPMGVGIDGADDTGESPPASPEL